MTRRHGVAPQMASSYPDYDVIDNASHWDATTRDVVLARLHPPAYRFFTDAEIPTLERFCDVVLDQDREPRIAVLAFVDEKLALGKLDGWRFDDMPDDRDVWRLVACALDGEAQLHDNKPFSETSIDVASAIIDGFASGRVSAPEWRGLNSTRAWGVVMRSVLGAFYAHPWAWNEIGFNGPAYPRGYTRLDGHAETWEAVER